VKWDAARWPPLLYLGFAHACLATAFAITAGSPSTVGGFYYHPRLIAVVHLVTLGWVSSSILGALYLVGPLTFRIALPGSWRDNVAFAAWAIAVSGVAAHFWLETLAGVAWAGVVALAAMAYVAARVLRRLPRAPVPIEARLPVMLAIVNMLGAALLGIALGFNKSRGFLPTAQLDAVIAHAHLAGLGWGAMMVMGVGYRMLPMMLPAAPPKGKGPLLATLVTEGGVWMLVSARLTGAGPRVSTTAAIACAAGIVLFLVQVAGMLRHRRPPPTALPRPDPGVFHAMAAIGWLAIATAVGVWLAVAPASEATLAGALAYGVIALVGFLAQIVVGVAARLMPLSAWLWGFTEGGHRALPPSPHGALSRPVQLLTLALWTAGVPGLALGLALDRHPWISASAGGLAVAVLLGGANLVVGIRRLSRSVIFPAAASP
jgi:hypothetical protein